MSWKSRKHVQGSHHFTVRKFWPIKTEANTEENTIKCFYGVITLKTTQSISLFLFLSSKPSRKHLDKVFLTSYIRGRAAHICIICRREINRCSWDLSSRRSLMDALLWGVPGDSRASRRNVRAATNPGSTWGIHSASPGLSKGLGERRATTWGETENLHWPLALSLR